MSPPPNLSTASDQKLVALARENREEAYREIVHRYKGRVFGLIYGMVGRRRETARDLAQETFVKAVDSLDQYRPELEFSAWLLSIAKHTAIDYLRRKEPSPLPLEDGPDVSPPPGTTLPAAFTVAEQSEPTPAARVRARELGPALEQAIRRLRGPYRRCIMLRYLEERSYDDISEIMGMPLGTVKSHVNRGRKELKKLLGEDRVS